MVICYENLRNDNIQKVKYVNKENTPLKICEILQIKISFYGYIG